jgi:P27 family predicted phage terminase small subunit
MKGPAPAPTALKILKGVRPARINQNEPKPRSVSGELPIGWGKSMSIGSRQFWKKYAPMLSALGVLTEADLPALRTLAELSARWLRLGARVNKGKIKPDLELQYLRILNQIETQVLRYLQQFGMTPSSRGKIVVVGAGDDEDKGLD